MKFLSLSYLQICFKKFIILLGHSIFLIIFSNTVMAKENPDWIDTMNDAQAGVTKQWISLTDGLDRILSGDTYDEEYADQNSSYLKVTLSQDWNEVDGFEHDMNIRARVDLPNTEKRFRLLIDSEDSTDVSLEDSVLEKDSSDDSLRNIAFEWISRQTDKLQESIRIGARSIPIDPYIRYKKKNNYTINEEWNGEWDTKIYYSREDRLRAKTGYAFIKPLDAQTRLINRSQLYWRSDEDNLEMANVSSYHHNIDQRRSYSHSFGMIANTEPETEISNYFLRTKYLQTLYKDWVIGEISPYVTFPSSEDFSAVFGVNAEIAVYFK